MSTPPVAAVPTLELMAATPTPAVRVRLPTAKTLEALSDPLASVVHDCLRLISFETLVKQLLKLLTQTQNLTHS